LDLREFQLSARQFTWANNLPIPTYEKLDRIMVSTDWKLKYPKVTVQAITRHLSDHTLLLIDTGEITPPIKIQLFKFELEDFCGIVAEIWQQENNGHTPLQIWQNKLRRLRQYLRGGSKNYIGAFRKEKKELSDRIDQLDKKAEMIVLQQHEVDLQYCLKERLTTLLREEEIKWHQRSKTDHLLKGDSNIKYFQLVANGKHRKHAFSARRW
jgi:hypothetical protein